VQAGAPLREGGTVTFVVDAGIRDAAGAELVEGAARTYRVGPAIRSRIDPLLWEARWPEADESRLSVRFDRPLDRALVRRYLQVRDSSGQPVQGTAELNADATEWSFAATQVPDEWALALDTRLEDLAGNSVRYVFDRDLDAREDDGIDDAELLLRPPRK
jgi:hypothetical protein